MGRILFFINAVCIITSLMTDVAHSEPINLNKRELYIKKGFSKSWLTAIPENDDTWIKIAPSRTDNRIVRIRDLPLPDLPERHFLSFEEHNPITCTFLTNFNIPDAQYIEEHLLGLLIRQIADNWEIYLNGHLIRSETYLSSEGEIEVSRNIGFVLVKFMPHQLKPGRNVLAFKIIGDPTSSDTGFYRGAPFMIDDYESLLGEKSETVTLILICIYLFVGFYHLILFLNRRSEKYNLFYGLFSIMLFIYLFMRSHAVYSFIFNADYKYIIEFCSLYSLFPLIGFFFDYILYKRISTFIIIYSIFCSLLIIVTPFIPILVMVDILRIWQYTAILPLGYILIFVIGRSFVKTVNDERSSTNGKLIIAIGRAMKGSVAGNILIGAIVILVCTVIDILDALFFATGIVLSNYGFFFFIIGITFILSNRFIYIHKKVEGLNLDLQQKVSDLNQANIQITLSEEKYRVLVEGSSDIIFSLDENLRFITANEAMFQQLSITRETMNSKTFLDILQDPSDRMSVTGQLVQEKLDQFLKDREPVNLKLEMKSAFGKEPKLMQVRLEFINIEGKNEILGKATSIVEDVLVKYLDSEKQRFIIGNYLIHADDISHRITRNLQKYLNKKDINLIRIAVREMIINAIEHGNLEVEFDEKTREIDNDNYINFVNERQHNQKYRGRRVTIIYGVNSDMVTYKIKDNGRGFDHEKYLYGMSQANEMMLAHGRGIVFAKNVFDKIKYNDLGNEVHLVKYFKKDDI